MQPRRRSTSAAAFVAAVSVVFVGCDDATTDPLARLVAEETAGALAIGVELPDPGSWDVPTDIAPEDADALARWAMSWEGPASLARETRETAYSRLAALFAARLGRGGIAEQAARHPVVDHSLHCFGAIIGLAVADNAVFCVDAQEQQTGEELFGL